MNPLIMRRPRYRLSVKHARGRVGTLEVRPESDFADAKVLKLVPAAPRTHRNQYGDPDEPEHFTEPQFGPLLRATGRGSL